LPRRGRRGYPAAILIGIDDEAAHIWLVYSESVKPGATIEKGEDGEKASYKFYEKIIAAIKTLLPEGFNSVIVASEDKGKTSSLLTEHVAKHHRWLMDKATLRTLTGRAGTSSDVIQLIKANKLQETVKAATEATGSSIAEQLERDLELGAVLYTIEEVGEALERGLKPSKLLMTEKFYGSNQWRSRFQSIVQVSKNLGATVTIINSTNPGSARLSQLGGFVCVIRHQS
jgi:stalled ribosome rescue protein Dom34